MNNRHSDRLNHLPADRLGLSNTIGLLALGIALTCMALIFLDSSIRSIADQAESRQLVRALGLNCLSLAPSGRPLRNVGAINPSIDFRFDPKLGQIHFDDADFILKGSD